MGAIVWARQPEETDMIYAVNKRTKEHRVVLSNGSVCEKEWYKGRRWGIIKADENGWIEWHGGECPLPDNQRCEVKDEDGEVFSFYKTIDIGDSSWREYITAYRPILEETLQPPEWDGEGLPSTGIECEIQRGEGLNWYKVKIRGYSPNKAYVWISDDGGEGEILSTSSRRYKFRPIRTDREKWIDAAIKALKPTMGRFAEEKRSLVGIIFDAGLARFPGEDRE